MNGQRQGPLQTGRLTACRALVPTAGRPPRATHLFENTIEMTEWRQGPPPAGRPGGRRGGGPQAMTSPRQISSGEPFDTSMERIGSPPADMFRRRSGGGPARADRTASNSESHVMSERLQGPLSAGRRGGHDGGPLPFGRPRDVSRKAAPMRGQHQRPPPERWIAFASAAAFARGRRRPDATRLVRRRSHPTRSSPDDEPAANRFGRRLSSGGRGA